MYKLLNPDPYLQAPELPTCLLSHNPGGLVSDMLSHQEEEEEEEAGECPVICHNVVGCGESISQADDAHWSICEHPIHSESSTTSSLTGYDPSFYLSQHQMKGFTTDYVEVSQHSTGGCCCEGLRMETNGCLGAYEQREPNFGPCWTESPCVYYGVRRNVVLGVEVVEEVAVEDTLEVILEDVQADDLLDIEVLEHEHLYPT
ncbi:uncharacterized protein LOC108243202 [Kryptolebias marmoratus]|uniref:uncharacterized protein LOC108243202 n=1 Tax=Kryptolebias marmoratus TaxID=37003 RepID=UPI0007F91BE8|nr:uncharacterized protein LOC108243202 [Kryptolebias marmoratus]